MRLLIEDDNGLLHEVEEDIETVDIDRPAARGVVCDAIKRTLERIAEKYRPPFRR